MIRRDESGVGADEYDVMGEGHEEAVVGFLMVYPAFLIEFGPLIGPALFCHEKNQLVLGALADLFSEGTPISLLAVTDRLRRTGKLEAAGGVVYLTHLAGDFFIGREAFSYALEELQAAAARRAVSAIGKRMLAGDLSPEEAVSELQLAEGEAVSGSRGLTVRTAEELRTMALDEHDCLMGDRILAKGQSLVIAGAGGIGKSRLLLQLAAACLTGRPWCGFQTHAKRSRWLILQTENSNRRLQKDLQSLQKWCGPLWAEVGESLFIHTLESDRDGILTLADGNVRQLLHALIQQVKPDVIGSDPLRDLMIGDPNSDADMATTLAALGSLCRRGNKQRAILILHHALTGKSGAAKASGYERSGFARNSKVLNGWTRAQINIAPGSAENNETLVLTCGKNSNGKEFPSLAVQLNPSTMIYEPDDMFDLEGWREEVAGGSRSSNRKSYSPSVVKEVLGGVKMLKKGLAQSLRAETGCCSSRAYELIDEAEKERSIRRNRASKLYEITA